jgi:hypothetical protein
MDNVYSPGASRRRNQETSPLPEIAAMTVRSAMAIREFKIPADGGAASV